MLSTWSSMGNLYRGGANGRRGGGDDDAEQAEDAEDVQNPGDGQQGLDGNF